MINLVHGLLMGLFYVEMGKFSFGCIKNMHKNKLQGKLVSINTLFINLYITIITKVCKVNGFTLDFKILINTVVNGV